MLVLSRHRNEAFLVGHDIRIVVVDIRGDKARLGIDAPADVPVHREEVYNAIIREGRNITDPLFESHWYDDPVNVAALGRFLLEADSVTAEELQQYYESPETHEADWQGYLEQKAS